MNKPLRFHPLVQKDFNEILEFYENQAGPDIAARFEDEVRMALRAIRQDPKHFPFYLKQRLYRRCRLAIFPHVILFREERTSIRIMILKHEKRHPNHGMRRK